MWGPSPCEQNYRGNIDKGIHVIVPGKQTPIKSIYTIKHISIYGASEYENKRAESISSDQSTQHLAVLTNQFERSFDVVVSFTK